MCVLHTRILSAFHVNDRAAFTTGSFSSRCWCDILNNDRYCCYRSRWYLSIDSDGESVEDGLVDSDFSHSDSSVGQHIGASRQGVHPDSLSQGIQATMQDNRDCEGDSQKNYDYDQDDFPNHRHSFGDSEIDPNSVVGLWTCAVLSEQSLVLQPSTEHHPVAIAEEYTRDGVGNIPVSSVVNYEFIVGFVVVDQKGNGVLPHGTEHFLLEATSFLSWRPCSFYQGDPLGNKGSRLIEGIILVEILTAITHVEQDTREAILRDFATIFDIKRSVKFWHFGDDSGASSRLGPVLDRHEIIVEFHDSGDCCVGQAVGGERERHKDEEEDHGEERAQSWGFPSPVHHCCRIIGV